MLIKGFPDYYIQVYSKYLWTWSPLCSNIWFIGNEESWVWNLEQSKNKLYCEGLINSNDSFETKKWISYLYDPTFDRRSTYNDPPDWELIKNDDYYFFAKKYDYKNRITESEIRNDRETGCIYDSYFELYKNLNTYTKIPYSRYDFLNKYFIWDFYYLPSWKWDIFDKIYNLKRTEFYTGVWNALLRRRVLHLREILDDTDNYEGSKLIFFFWNDKIKNDLLNEYFWSFQEIWRISTFDQKQEEEKIESILYTEYEGNNIFILPFISRIKSIDDLADFLNSKYLNEHGDNCRIL